MKIHLLLLLTLLPACESRELSGSASKGTAAKGKSENASAENAGSNQGASAPLPAGEAGSAPSEVEIIPGQITSPSPMPAVVTNPAANPSPVPGVMPSPGPAPELEPVAQPPTVVSGAFLVCSKNAKGASCVAKNSSGATTPIAATQAYYARTDLKWTETTFTVTPTQGYQVDVPATVLGSYAIAINTNNATYADWVISKGTTVPENLVRNGSFEDFMNAGMYTNNFNWTAVRATGVACADTLFLEAVKPDPVQFEVSDGAVAIDLNSMCFTNSGASNPLIRQDLTLLKDRIYQLRFDVSKHWQYNGASNYTARWNGQYVAGGVVAAAAWTEVRAVKVFATAGGSLDFQETAPNNDNNLGTLIDNVRIYDLGVVPRQ